MSPLFIKEFGALMKVTRLKRKLSYEQLSEKMEYPKAKSTLKRYEDGVAKKLDFLTIRDICDVLMLDVNKVIDVFEKTGRLDQEDLDLHGTLNNSQIANIPSTSFPCVPDLADTCIFRHFSAFRILALPTFSNLGINSVSRRTSQSLA